MPPEFRCLLCDLVLADEGTPGTRKCDQCGKFVLIDQPVEPQPLLNLTTVAPPPIPDAPTPIPTVAPMVPRGYLPRPNAAPPLVDLSSLPEAAVSRPVPSLLPPPPPQSKLVPFNPNFVPDPERPKPQMFKALFVLLLMIIAGIIATTIIGYAIARGLKKAKKVGANNDNTGLTTPTLAGTPPTTGTTRPTPVQPRITGPSIWAPATSTFSVLPGKLEPRTVQLPSAATEGVYAGNARFILWHMPRIEMVAVWDTSKLAFHGYIPAPGVRSHIAASANRAFVVSTDRGTITSFKLTDLTLEKTVYIENLGKPVAAVAGHMSDGPLFVIVNKDRVHRLSLADPATLELKNWKSVLLPQKQSESPFLGMPGDRAFIRCSANGKIVIAGVATGQKDFDVDTAELYGDELLIAPAGKSSHPIGLTAEGRPMVDGRPGTGARFPMSIGSGYFTMAGKPGRAVLDFSNDVFIQRGELEAEGFHNHLDVDDESPRDRWAFLALAARAFIYLGDDRKEFKVVPVDIDKSMPASKLLIRSAPPQFAIKGQKWSYELRTAPQGGIQVKLDSAPENMTVDGNKLLWTVPADTNLSEVKVELTVTSDLDEKAVARQSFSVAVRPTQFAVNVLTVPGVVEPRIAELKTERGNDLQFTSKPVSKVKPGDEYRLAVKIISPSDKIKVALMQAPEAMKWDGESLVWKIPASQPKGYYPVVLQTETKFQAFNIWVTKD